MIFENKEAAVAYIKSNADITPKFILDARVYSKELCALITGEGFLDELISKIENIESENKAKARKKYSRDLRDLFSRLSAPIENVFSATGGVKDYQNGEVKLSETNLKKLLQTINNVRDGKSIERYIETQWLPLFLTDPAGVLLMRYKVDSDEVDIYPTYQSIGVIRTYIDCGQCVENLLLEPEIKQDGTKVWILLDDKMQYTVNQKGNDFTIDPDALKTFEHPFGSCPAVINSNITDKYGNRLSPFDVIVPAAKEYARDLSMKTITKAIHGSIIHWRRESICASCHGTRKNGDKPCTGCSPTGETAKSDVTDLIVLPFNSDIENQIKGSDIAGFVSPDTSTWEAFTDELKNEENQMYESLWGVANKTQVSTTKGGGTKTATQVHYDLQPQIQHLNKYADVAEWIEWKITEWCANIIDLTKDKESQISLIVYGRRYILEGIDTIQEKYENAKKAGENTVVLDGIFDELLTVKFKNDTEWMKTELKKAQCEPYLHYSAAEINTFFGANETAKKIYFQSWWKNLTAADLQKEINILQSQFIKDFDLYLPTLKIVQPIPVTSIPGVPANQ